MSSNYSEQGNLAIISVHDRFVFANITSFRSAVEEAINAPHVRQIRVDCAQLHYIDSAALGMLLQLKAQADTSNKTVIISGANGEVLKVLNTANFSKIFAME